MEQSHAPTADDAALLRRYAGAADAAAFAELVRRYAGMVYATARRVTGSASAAEDVSQDCFLRLARASNGIEGSLPAWLHRTSLNRSLELVRSDRARRRREIESANVARDDDGRDESARLIAHVDEAMGKLPDELRVILAEHFLCGRTQQEIAGIMAVDQSTISRRIERGLDELRDRLRAQGVAVAALPMVLTSTTGAAPPTLHAALTKIGLSGVREASATLSKNAVLTATAAAAAVLAIVVAGGLWLRGSGGGAARGGRGIPTAAAPATAPAVARDDDEEEDEEDEEDENEEEDGFEMFDRN